MRGMEAAILPLRQPSAAVRVEHDRLVIERLVVSDPAVIATLAERSPDELPAVLERAVRIGLLAIADAGVAVNVDVVRTEFERLLDRTTQANERATAALEATLRANFADGDGRLPRTLERFLGDRGALRAFVNELFDESKRDSAIGRMSALLGSYFDGDASRLARLLDPTRLGSPMHQFRQEMTDGFTKITERLTAIEAASKARAEERARGTAKGVDFEDQVESALGDIARGAGDLVERTTTLAGSVAGSKKGDFVLTLDPAIARGCDLRVVIEAKDRALSTRAIRDELREARVNRDAAAAVMVFTAQAAPAGVAPFTLVGDDVICVVDTEGPDEAVLEAAVRLARLLALRTVAERSVEIDAQALGKALAGVREELDAVRSMKTQLTSVRTLAQQVSDGLEGLRSRILGRVADAESELWQANR
jgi:hypothetical protein